MFNNFFFWGINLRPELFIRWLLATTWRKLCAFRLSKMSFLQTLFRCYMLKITQENRYIIFGYSNQIWEGSLYNRYHCPQIWSDRVGICLCITTKPVNDRWWRQNMNKLSASEFKFVKTCFEYRWCCQVWRCVEIRTLTGRYTCFSQIPFHR